MAERDSIAIPQKQQNSARPVLVSGKIKCETLYDNSRQLEEEDRQRHQEGQSISQQTPSSPTAPLQTQNPNLGQRQWLLASAYTQAAADTGARQGHHTPVQTQFTGLGVLQALVAPSSTQVADMSISARRGFHPAQQTQLAGLDQRQALLAPAPTAVADMGARRAHSASAPTQLANLDHRQPLSARSPKQVEVADLGARRVPAFKRPGHKQYVHSIAVIASTKVKARRDATTRNDSWNRKSVIASAL